MNRIPVDISVYLTCFYCFHARFIAGFYRMSINSFTAIPAFFAGVKTENTSNGEQEYYFFHEPKI